ncbi:hypothetical protein [Mycobacterium sp. pR1184]|uniref:hypothetical protein n=1 Tax=Mycobacterium sp. pR1184 TaxID=3238981 RepID=UPI00351BD910
MPADRDLRVGRIHLRAALSRGATFPELMQLLDRYQRLSREWAALKYELSSPFNRA